MKLFEFTVKVIVGLFSVFGLAGYGYKLIQSVTVLLYQPTPLYLFIAGMLIFTLLWYFFLSRRGNFWSTLEHELTHALFALLFFKPIHSISASRKRGGLISIEGGNFLIALSPYFFPLAAMAVLGFTFLIPEKLQPYMIFLLGFSYQFHIVNLFKEFHPGQSDLQRSGFLFSIIFIIFSNILFLGLILSGLNGGWKTSLIFLWDGLKLSLYYAISTGQFILN